MFLLGIMSSYPSTELPMLPPCCLLRFSFLTFQIWTVYVVTFLIFVFVLRVGGLGVGGYYAVVGDVSHLHVHGIS